MQFSGIFGFSWWEVLLYTLLLTHITIASVTIFLHRHQAHRALTLHPLPSHFFRFWLWMTTGMVTRQWTAIHRKHHARCETIEDPHSPQIKGLHEVLTRGAELYQIEAANADTLERYGKGTPDDWLEHKIYSRYPYLGISLMLVIDLLIFGPIGLTIWAVQMIWIPLFAAGVINGVGHYSGYRNAATPDASTNILPWGILIGGEELHNNHHAWPGSARLSYQPWEFDIGWLYIRILQALRLARVKRVSPAPQRFEQLAPLNTDTLRLLLQQRMQLLASYSRQVIRRIHREEIRRVGHNRELKALLKRAGSWLQRDESLLDPTARQGLGEVLQRSEALCQGVAYRQRLQAIWGEAASQPEKAIQTLQQWCREAEASGNRYLQAFAERLSGDRLLRSR